jgi:hypothetical protein
VIKKKTFSPHEIVLMTVSRVLNRKIKMPPLKQTKQTNEILIKTEKMVDRVPIIEKEKAYKNFSHFVPMFYRLERKKITGDRCV